MCVFVFSVITACGRGEVKRRSCDSLRLRNVKWCQRKSGRLRKTHDTHTKKVQIAGDEEHTTTKHTSTSLFLSSDVLSFVFLAPPSLFLLPAKLPNYTEAEREAREDLFHAVHMPIGDVEREYHGVTERSGEDDEGTPGR